VAAGGVIPPVGYPASVGRPKGLSGDARRTAILDAAEVEFGLRGQHAQLAAIGREVGISRPSVLHHYKTKDGLYEAVVRRLFADLTRAFGTEMLATTPFRQRLVGLFETYIDFARARPAFARIVLREVVDGEGPARAMLRDQLVPLLDLVEGFLTQPGQDVVPEGTPVRAIILQLGANELLRTASGDLEQPLWRDAPGTMELLTEYFRLDD